MQINYVSNQQPTFGKLISGDNLKRTLCPQKQSLINNYNVIKIFIREEKLHKMPNVNIILDYSNAAGFYGVITDKSKNIPNSKNYFCKINTSNSALETFKQWVNNWNKKMAN